MSNVFDLSASLSLDTRDFVNSLSQAERNMQDLQRTFSGFNTNVTNLQHQIQNTGTAITHSMSQANSGVSGSISGINSSVNNSGSTVANFAQSFKDKFSSLGSKVKEASNHVLNFGDVLKANILSDVISKGIDAIANGFNKIIGAVSSFTKNSVSAGMNFDSAMSQVAATMGKSVDEIQELRDFAKEMGATTKYSATESAQALNYMALAGYDAEKSMKMLPNVMNLASAGGFELQRASDMITDTETAFGLETERVTQLVDEMAKAASTGNTNVEQLGDAFLVVGGLAKELNGGMVELADGTSATVDGVTEMEIALVAMANAGVKGSEAGTHMRNMIMKLSNPTDEAKELFEQMGISAFDATGHMKSLHDVFSELNRAFQTMTQEDKLKAIGEIFNARDIASANALLGAVEQNWDYIGESILNAEGAASKMAATQLNNLKGAKTIFTSAKEGLQINISDALNPMLLGFTKFAAVVAQSLTDTLNAQGVSGLRKTVAKIVTDLGKTIRTQIPNIVKGVTRVLNAVKGGIADGLPELSKALNDTIKKVSKIVMTNLPQTVKVGVKLITEISNSISKNLSVLLPAITEIIVTVIENLTSPENISTIIDSGITLISAIGQGLVDSAPKIIERVPEIIKNIQNGITQNEDKIKEAGSNIISMLSGALGENSPDSGDIGAFLENLNTKISDGISGIDFSSVTSKISEMIIGVTDAAGNLIGGLDWAVIGNAIGEALNGVDWFGILQSVFKTIETTISSSGDLLTGIAKAIDVETGSKLIAIGGGIFAGKVIAQNIGKGISLLLGQKIAAPILAGLGKIPLLAAAALGGWSLGTVIREAIGAEKIDLYVGSFIAALEKRFAQAKHIFRLFIFSIKDMFGTLFGTTDEKKSIEEYTQIEADYQNDLAKIDAQIDAQYDTSASPELTDIERVNSVRSLLGNGISDTYNHQEGIKKILGVDDSWTWGSDLVTNFSTGISDNQYKVTDSIAEVANEIAATMKHSVPEKGPLSNDDQWTPDMMQNFADGITNNENLVTSKITSLAGKIKTELTSKVNEAGTWGSDLIQNFINGISSMWDSLTKTISDVADTIADYIGFSEPKRGSLSEFHTFAPDMMNLFVSGINANSKKVENAIGKIAEDISDETKKISYNTDYDIQKAGNLENDKAATTAIKEEYTPKKNNFSEGISKISAAISGFGEILGKKTPTEKKETIEKTNTIEKTEKTTEIATKDSPEIKVDFSGFRGITDTIKNFGNSIKKISNQDKTPESRTENVTVEMASSNGIQGITNKIKEIGDFFVSDTNAKSKKTVHVNPLDSVAARAKSAYNPYFGEVKTPQNAEQQQVQAIGQSAYTTVNTMTVNVPGININSVDDMENLADVLVNRISDRLNAKAVYDNRGLGGVGF